MQLDMPWLVGIRGGLPFSEEKQRRSELVWGKWREEGRGGKTEFKM